MVTLTTQRVVLTTDFDTTSTTFVDVTAMSITLANRTGGKFLSSCCVNFANSTANAIVFARMVEGATNHEAIGSEQHPSFAGLNRHQPGTLPVSGDLDGDVLKLQIRSSTGTSRVRADVDFRAVIDVLEVS